MTPLEGPERRRAFCARLKSERERRGTSLRDIAESTKVKASLLEALERGDVSRWPKGIYRRSFFRDYVASLGLPCEPYAAEFLELFPDADEPPITAGPLPRPAASARASSSGAADLRLTLAQEPSRWRLRVAGRPAPLPLAGAQPLAAAIDLALVAGVAFGLTALGVATLERTAVAVGAIYFTLATALLGRSPAAWLLARAIRIAPSPVVSATAAPLSAEAALDAAQRSNLRRLAGQALRARSALRAYVGQLSRATRLNAASERRRELEHSRRRRVEAANRTTVDGAV